MHSKNILTCSEDCTHKKRKNTYTLACYHSWEVVEHAADTAVATPRGFARDRYGIDRIDWMVDMGHDRTSN